MSSDAQSTLEFIRLSDYAASMTVHNCVDDETYKPTQLW